MLLFILIITISSISSLKNNTIWNFGLFSFAVFAFFSYPLKEIEFQLLLPILISSCLLDKNSIVQMSIKGTSIFSTEKINIICIIITTFLTFITIAYALLVIVPDLKQQKWAKNEYKKIELWYKTEHFDYIADNCDTLLPYMKHDYHFLFAYGQALNKTGNYEKSDSVLKMGSEISSDPMFWNVMGNNSLAQGHFREAEVRYKHAFYMVPNRLYPLYLLAKLYHTEGDTARFLDMAERVETFIPKVESINTERLRAEIRKWKSDYLPDAVTKDD